MIKPTLSELLPKKIDPAPKVPEGMNKFTIYRTYDTSGVSGVGIVIQGVLFANGRCAIQWLVGPDPGDTQIKQDWGKFLEVHVYSHPENITVLTWENGDIIIFPNYISSEDYKTKNLQELQALVAEHEGPKSDPKTNEKERGRK